MLTPIVEAQLTLQAEFRTRFEFRDGYKTLSDNDNHPALVTSQRNRINMNYEHDGIIIYLSIQDVRVWGDEIYKTDNSVINVYQAYAGYSFNKAFSLRVGRQELLYDNGRIVGPSNWNNVGASHDVLRLMYQSAKTKADAVITYNNDKEKNLESNYPLNFYKYLSIIWVNQSIGDKASISVMNIIDGKQAEESNTKIYNRLTSGFYTNINSANKNLGGDASFYYQYGNAPQGNPLSAYFFSLSAFLKPIEKAKILMGMEYFSGDDAINPDKTSNSFDKLYGNGHAFNGYMDYFTDFPKHVNNGGFMNTYFRLTYNPAEKTSLELTCHNFRLTNNIIDSLSTPGVIKAAKKLLGNEIDLMIKHKLHKSVELGAGYSTLFASDTMEILKDGDAGKFQHWVWVMLTFKPTLFKHEF